MMRGFAVLVADRRRDIWKSEVPRADNGGIGRTVVKIVSYSDAPRSRFSQQLDLLSLEKDRFKVYLRPIPRNAG